MECHPTESHLSFWLSWGLLLAGLGAGFASAYIVITTYSPLPHWDEWSLFDHLATGGGWSLPWLWAQHNEHRIFVAKIFFLLDVELFHGTQTFLLISIFLVQLLQVALLSWSLRVFGGLRGSAWRVGTGLIAYCILCPTQYENFVWGFQLQFVVSAAMATLTVLGLLLYQSEVKARFLAVSVAAATVATWSLANGMLLWPLLLFVALWLRMKSPAWVTLLIAALCNIGLYFYHYHRPAAKMTLPLLSRRTCAVRRRVFRKHVRSALDRKRSIHRRRFGNLRGLDLSCACAASARESFALSDRAFVPDLAVPRDRSRHLIGQNPSRS